MSGSNNSGTAFLNIPTATPSELTASDGEEWLVVTLPDGKTRKVKRLDLMGAGSGDFMPKEGVLGYKEVPVSHNLTNADLGYVIQCADTATGVIDLEGVSIDGRIIVKASDSFDTAVHLDFGISSTTVKVGEMEEFVRADGEWKKLGQESLKPYKLIVMGESHALGRATSGGSESKSPIAGVKILSASSDTFETWDVADATQIQPSLNGGGGWSSGSYCSAFFAAKRIHELTGRDVHVIMEAEGGEKIANFVPESSNHWLRLLSQIATSGWSAIDGVFIHQGANDTATNTSSYLASLEAWVDQVEALTEWRLGNPIVLGGLKTASTQHQNIKNVADARVSVGYVPFNRLELLVDGVHWTADANIEAGSAIASQLMYGALQSIDLAVATSDSQPLPWLDFNASHGVVVNGVDDVDWSDSIAGRTFTTATTGFNLATNPTNGLPEMRRTGSGVLSLALGASKSAPYSVVAVMVFDSATLTSANQYVFRVHDGSTKVALYTSYNNSGKFTASSIGTGVIGDPAPVTDAPMMVCATFDGASIKIYDESGLIGAGTRSANAFAGTLDIGSSSHSSPYGVQRLKVYSSALTAQQVEVEMAALVDIYK